MRAKDMVDLEAKAHQVKVEKQMRLLEKAGELERALNSQLVRCLSVESPTDLIGSANASDRLDQEHGVGPPTSARPAEL